MDGNNVYPLDRQQCLIFCELYPFHHLVALANDDEPQAVEAQES